MEINVLSVYLSMTVTATALLLVPFGPVHGQDVMTPGEALDEYTSLAEQARESAASLSFEDFKNSVYKESFAGGKFIVNGDTPISDEKALREFYERNIANSPVRVGSGRLAVHVVGGVDAIWSQAQKRALTYCVSRAFGARYYRVVADMDLAARAWEAVADLDFVHLAVEDDNCNAQNSNVMFDVRPVHNQRYLARAFFPGEGRVRRNVLIDESSFELDPNQNLTLVGILRHELGHTIGARHEHTRPESGACFEDNNWRGVTRYDAFSVMHYPQCNGQGDWKLTLTAQDQSGIACLYGAQPWFLIDDTVCQDETTITLEDQQIAQGEAQSIGEYPVAPGSSFRVYMAAPTNSDIESGDPDLYVRFGAEPQVDRWDCRPYTVGAIEVCDLTVPHDVESAFVEVRGYARGRYRLWVAHRF